MTTNERRKRQTENDAILRSGKRRRKRRRQTRFGVAVSRSPCPGRFGRDGTSGVTLLFNHFFKNRNCELRSDSLLLFGGRESDPKGQFPLCLQRLSAGPKEKIQGFIATAFVTSPGKKMSELSEEVSSSSSSLASLLSSGGEDDLVLLVPKKEEEEEVPSPPDYSSVLLDELLESAKKYPGKRVKL